MRYTRQNKILELIKDNEIETQQQLVDMLNQSGFEVTQATISRDINNLQLIKQNRNGKSCYTVPAINKESSNDKFNKIMKDTIVSIDSAENMIVIKTLAGCAGPACEAIDMQKNNNILGTLAGENTIFVVCRSTESTTEIIENIKKVIA